MTEQLVRLSYPASLLDVPVINQLIRRYDLTVNILRAQVSPEEGWVHCKLTGDTSAIVEAIDWLSNQGVDVELLKDEI